MPEMPRLARLRALLLASAAAAAVAAAGAACAGATAPRGAPHLVGTAARVGALGDPATVLVGDLLVPAAGYEAGVALDVGDARIYVRLPGGRRARGRVSDVAVGTALRAWSTGVEERSLLPRWEATWVEVTPAAGR